MTYDLDLGVKSAVKNWLENKWENWVKRPIANRTEQMENQVSQKASEYSGKVKEQIKKPGDYYWKQDAFYRGLFWIGVGLLIVLWILSGS